MMRFALKMMPFVFKNDEICIENDVLTWLPATAPIPAPANEPSMMHLTNAEETSRKNRGKIDEKSTKNRANQAKIDQIEQKWSKWSKIESKWNNTSGPN